MNPSITRIAASVFLLASITIRATEFCVAPNGNDANPGTKEKPFATFNSLPGNLVTSKAARSATNSFWKGEFLAAQHAGMVYALFGRRGVGTERMPAPDTSTGRHIGYHVRTGPHDILEADWKHHLDFADRHLKKP